MNMRLNHKKIELALARKEIEVKAFCEEAGISTFTFYRIMHGKPFRIRTAGRLARALGVDVTEILEEESA